MECISNNSFLSDFEIDIQIELEKIERRIQAIEKIISDDCTQEELSEIKTMLHTVADRLNILYIERDDQYNEYVALSTIAKGLYDGVCEGLGAATIPGNYIPKNQ